MFYDAGRTYALYTLGLEKAGATVLMPALAPAQQRQMRKVTGFGETASTPPDLRRQNMRLQNRLTQLYERHIPQEVLSTATEYGATRGRRYQPAVNRGMRRIREALPQTKMIGEEVSRSLLPSVIAEGSTKVSPLRALLKMRV